MLKDDQSSANSWSKNNLNNYLTSNFINKNRCLINSKNLLNEDLHEFGSFEYSPFTSKTSAQNNSYAFSRILAELEVNNTFQVFFLKLYNILKQLLKSILLSIFGG